MERNEEAACLLILLCVWWKMRQRIQDEKINAERRLRRQRMLAARRERAMQRRACELQRQRKRQLLMAMMMHHYYTTIRRPPRVWAYPRTGDWWENTAQRFTDDQWLEDFRVSRDTFTYICSTLKSALQKKDTRYRLCIPLEKRIAIALYKLASSSEYGTVANLFAVSRTSVCHCVHDFCKAVIAILRPKFIQTPDRARLSEIADFFEEKYGIPQCVGAIHGCHIPILKPSQYESDFDNGEGWQSIILQAVVDGKGMFWDLDIGQPGSKDDSSVLRKSHLWTWATTSDAFSSRVKDVCGTDVGYFILGDSAYPLQRWLLKPYPGTGRITDGQELYNAKTNQAHCVVKQAFGRLKGRWKCISKKNNCSVNLVIDMVEACCTLHNLCELRMDRFLPEWGADGGKVLERPPCDVDDDGSDARNALEQLFMQQQQL
ncbi:putative nuclease HARBI1 isoform X1 [Misgurnus anguillicaudatus]|uniref:putative nuclease HARBI1 isoform X1 n=1 Tax=Misgurnus anguillicaudatus TaxID=75329 RepID=UPI003CCF8E6E